MKKKAIWSMISCVQMLCICIYATGEKRLETRTEKDHYDEDVMISTEEVDVTATAKLLMYTTSNGWKGLMTEGKNLYLCSFDELSNYGVLLSF